MFVLVTGKPGSGKSYYAIDYMFSNKENYFSIESNINGLKFDGNIVALNFKRLHNIIPPQKSRQLFFFHNSISTMLLFVA